jgi:hypothetical protein
MSLKISQLQFSESLNESDLVPIVQNGTTKSTNISSISSAIFEKVYTTSADVSARKIAGINPQGLVSQVSFLEAERGLIVSTLKVDDNYYVLKGTPGDGNEISSENYFLTLEVYSISGDELELNNEISIGDTNNSDDYYRLEGLLYGSLKLSWDPNLEMIIFPVIKEMYDQNEGNWTNINSLIFVDAQESSFYVNEIDWQALQILVKGEKTYLSVRYLDESNNEKYGVVLADVSKNTDDKIDFNVESFVEFPDHGGNLDLIEIKNLERILAVPYWVFDDFGQASNVPAWVNLEGGNLVLEPVQLFENEGNLELITGLIYFRDGKGVLTTIKIDLNEGSVSTPNYLVDFSSQVTKTEISQNSLLLPIQFKLTNFLIDGDFVIIKGLYNPSISVSVQGEDDIFQSLSFKVIQFNQSNSFVADGYTSVIEFYSGSVEDDSIFISPSLLLLDKISTRFLLTKNRLVETSDEFYTEFQLKPVIREGVNLVQLEGVSWEKAIGFFTDSVISGGESTVKLFGQLGGFESLDPGMDYYLNKNGNISTNPEILKEDFRDQNEVYNQNTGGYDYITTVTGSVLKVGKAISSDTLFINISKETISNEYSPYYGYYGYGEITPPVEPMNFIQSISATVNTESRILNLNFEFNPYGDVVNNTVKVFFDNTLLTEVDVSGSSGGNLVFGYAIFGTFIPSELNVLSSSNYLEYESNKYFYNPLFTISIG